jgi:hypothetical protein
MKDKCKKCGSTNTKREYTRVGHFVDYYDLICKDCNNVEQCRT